MAVAAPALHLACAHEGARVLVAGSDCGNPAREALDVARRRAQVDRSVSELALVVEPPAFHGAGRGQGTGVVSAGGDRGDTGETIDVDRDAAAGRRAVTEL